MSDVAEARGSLPLLQFFARARDNWLATFPEAAYRQPIVEQRFLWRRSYLLNDPAGIKRVLLDNATNYSKTAIARALLEPGLGKGLITMEGEAWRQRRRTLAPSFDHQSLLAYAPIIGEVAEKLAERWTEQAGAVVEMNHEMMATTLRVISRTMLSVDGEAMIQLVGNAVERYQGGLRPSLLDFLGVPEWFPRPGRRRFAHDALGEFDRAIADLIALHRRAPDSRQDFLSRLLAARIEETGEGFSDQEIRDHLVTILMAGHETTSVALSWVWYLLSQHPAAEAKLHAELDRVLAGRTPRQEDMARLPYTRMVIEEAMRLYPPAHTMSRAALGRDEVCGQRIPRGAVIFIVPWILHRHRLLWQQPEEFDPERFRPETAQARSRFAYIPFGAGPRICIGAAFAMLEIMIVLATLAQRFRPRLVAGHKVEPRGVITLRMRHGLRMTLERR
jgi:cytochrome P450